MPAMPPTYLKVLSSYGPPQQLSCPLAGLPSHEPLLAGAATAAVTNTAGHLNYLLSGRFKLGAPALRGRVIEVWAYAGLAAGHAAGYPAPLTGLAGRFTLPSEQAKMSALRQVASIEIAMTGGATYDMAPVALAPLFGGEELPWDVGIFVVHNAGAALAAGELWLTPKGALGEIPSAPGS